MKQVKVLTGIAVAALSTGTGLVQADDLSNTRPAKAAEVVTHTEVTENQVADAKTKADQATQAVKDQEATVKAAEAEKTQAQQSFVEATTAVNDAEKLASEATPDGITQAQEAIEAAQETATAAQKDVAVKIQALEQAKEAVSRQETKVSDQKAQVDKASATVAKAQEAVAAAQATLDGTTQAQVTVEAEEAKHHLESAQEAVTKAEKAVVAAKEADQKRVETLAALTKELEQATKDHQAIQTAHHKAVLSEAETGTVLSQAQQKMAEVKAKVEAINTIVVSPEYVAALKDYNQNFLEKGAEAQAILAKLSPELKQVNKFKANPTDDKTLLDTNNLSESVRLELSNYAADLINQLRKAFGTAETVVTPSALTLADATTDGYVAHSWSMKDVRTNGHDAKAINDAAKSLGLKTTTPDQEKAGQQLYENMNSTSVSLASLTLSQAKELIYNALITFMFNGYEYLHAESIAGLTITSPSYLGVDLSARSDVTGVHFLQVEDKYLLANSSFDKTKQANPYDSTNLLTAYNQTKETLARAMDAYKVAQTALQKVEQEKVDSDTLLVNLNSQLTEVKRLSAKLPMAESHLITAKANLAQAIARDRKAQAAVKQLSGDVKTKKAALDQAKAELAQQEAALKQAQTALQAEETKLVTLKDKVTKAQESLAQAQVVLETAKTSLKAKETYLLALQEAPKRLENAKAALELAKTQLNQALNHLDHEVTVLKTLQAQEGELKNQYTKVLSAYQALLAAKRQAQLAEEKARIEAQGGQAIPLVDEKGQITGYVDGTKEVKPQVSQMASQQTLPQVKSSLPQTGEQGFSLLGLVGLGLLGLGGFLGLRKQEEK
ncbi:SEC10/PgrA surface exclusion domain-containing protein [Streptococcus canis]|uniref:SEC10/PgrA surface exclusion domain-containing protein n=2 Tax=Streptococcus canis TaxID=1329 RepID=UPI0011423303|nr:SEC10/PgrA surface exclusion domain-containing protein [Streptococcus canis]QKG78610.1 SEC10/PgrA surface exclusion domain-containing protein [Streptococcus canis]GEE06498.1 hypothetical protein ScOT1_05910 [Streptococcus canis]GFG41164.1 hypothetical protein ScFU29_00690 [Streptococcus canis]GMX39207.1 SEC10/PgrA surface exclusion domain-containing protein [Streptococcus canis]